MELNTQSEATLKNLGNMTVGELISKLEKYPAETFVMMSTDTVGLWPISCITIIKDVDNIRIVELS